MRAEQVPFILQYLDFLSSFNDDNNTRVVFEKVPSDLGRLWRCLLCTVASVPRLCCTS